MENANKYTPAVFVQTRFGQLIKITKKLDVCEHTNFIYLKNVVGLDFEKFELAKYPELRLPYAT
jgi:hypothetical protein